MSQVKLNRKPNHDASVTIVLSIAEAQVIKCLLGKVCTGGPNAVDCYTVNLYNQLSDIGLARASIFREHVFAKENSLTQLNDLVTRFKQHVLTN